VAYFIIIGGLLAHTVHKNIQRRKRFREVMKNLGIDIGNRSGFALPVVLLLLTVLSIVSVVFVTASNVEQQASRNVREQSRAFYATEGALSLLVSEFDSLRYDTLMTVPGDTLNLGLRTMPNGARVLTRLQRIDDDAQASLNTGHSLYAVMLEGRVPSSAKSVVSMVLRYRTVWPIGDPMAAIFAADGLKKASNNGMNTGVDLCTANEVGGVTVPIGGLDYNGSPTEVFAGTPPLNEVADVVQTMNDIGLDWAEILGMEFDYVINSSAQFPDFSTLPPDAYPTILFTGNLLTVKGAEDNGRGLLVVVNDLTMQSGWDWKGAIMVGERFQINNTITIEGALFSGLDVQLGESLATVDPSQIGPGATQITYNSCALAKATGWDDEGFTPVRIVNGTWVERW